MRLHALFVHPVKSLRGMGVERWPLDEDGLRGDRRWAVIDPDGTVLTQRTVRAMARVQAGLTAEALELSYEVLPPCRVPLSQSAGPRRTVTVWGDACDGQDEGDDVAAWLTAALGQPARLLKMPAEFERPVDPRYAPPDARTAFSDGFPLLVATTASLQALAEAAEMPLEIERFRPNVVIDGAQPWAEDTWQTLDVGGLTVELVKPCARCAIPTLDPRTGQGGAEPLRTLGRLRNWPQGLMFGWNALVRGTGELRVGTPVRVLAERSGPWAPPP